MQPNAVVFGEQVFHTNTQQTIDITNNGLAPLAIHQITLSSTDAFKFINKCPDTLVSGSRCTIDVQFTPQQAIGYTAMLTIDNSSSINHLSLSGSGIHPLLIQPRQLSFGEQTLDVKAQKTLTIVNAGIAPFTIEQVTLPDTEAFKIVTDNCSHLTLTDNACTIDIQFTPQQTIAYTTTLTIIYGTDKSNVSLSGSGIAAALSQRRYPDVPFIKDITAIPNPAQEEWKTYAGIAVVLLLILLAYLVRLWRSRQFPKETSPVWDSDKNKPRLFAMGNVGGKPQPRLSHTILDQLADSIDYFYSEQTSKRLDLKRSIRESLQHLVPTLIFPPRKQVRTVVILEDALAKPLTWNPIAQELANGLGERSITVLYGLFYGSPQQFYSTEGTCYNLKVLSYESDNYLLLIFSDGKSFRYQRDRAILAALSEWEQVAWMDLREVRAWDESAALPARFDLPVYPATANGLVQAIGGFLSESRRQNDFTEVAQYAPGLPVQIGDDFDDFVAYIRALLGDALLWAQCCAMLQPISLGLADGLRCRFFAQLPPERIERLFALPNTISTVNGLHFATPIIAILRLGFLRHFTDEEQQERLQFILDKLKAAEPKDKKSPAHLAWEWRYQRVNLELNPEQALKRLSELAGTPLGQTVRSELENTAPVQNNEKPCLFKKLGLLLTLSPLWQRKVKQEVLIPLRQRPKSIIALQQLRRLAKHSGIKKSFILPLGFAHRMKVSLLTCAFLGIFYYSWERYLTAQPQPPYDVKLANADPGVLAWGILPPNGALTYVSASEKLTLPPGSAQLTFLSHNGFIKALKIATLTDNSKIELGYDEQIRPCTEHFPKIGLTVQRCLDEPTASTLVIPTWHQSLKEAALQNRLLSIGLEIQTTPSDDLALQVLRQTLLETHSVDLFYRIQPASDGKLHLPDALATIQTQLAPWHQQSQLIWWAVGEQANESQLNDFTAAFGSVLPLAQSRDLSWVAAVQQLFTASESPIIFDAEIRAALGQPVEQIALIRQRNLVALLKTCQAHLNASRLTAGRDGNALACYQEVLKQVPTHAEALAGLEKIEARYVTLIENALTQGQQNQAKEYLASLRKVNSNSPKLAALEMQLQASLLKTCQEHLNANRLTKGRSGNALACYQEVLKKVPTHAEALAGLENIEARYVTLITRALDQGKLDKAETYLGRLHTVNPQSPLLAETELETRFQLVNCDKYFQTDHLITGEDGNALACYKEVLKKEPTNSKAQAGLEKIEARYVELIERALELGQPEKTEEYLACLGKVNSESSKLAGLETLVQLGTCDKYFQNRSYQNAQECYREVLKKEPTNAKALAGIEKIEMFSATSGTALDDYNLAQLKEKQSKLSEAQMLYGRVIKAEPNFAPAYANLAKLKEKQGKLAEAQWLYNRAIKADPNFALAYAGLGDVSMQLQDYWQAADMFQKFLTLQETSDDQTLQQYVKHYEERLVEAQHKITVFSTKITDTTTARGGGFGPPIIETGITFAYGSFKVTKQIKRQIQEIAKAIKAVFNTPGVENSRIRIEGHTDSSGRATYNQRLSLKRAQSVKTVLVNDFNIPADRLEVFGWGEEAPIASNQTAHGRFKNRRITLIKLDN
jgi:outer membrane protein OmpA-like peptidoglycan-associated protein